MQENQTDNSKKLYSQKSIAIATYLGGPLAAGVLIRRNFINLGNEDHGKNALVIGIISTILLFPALFLIPEHIIDKIPNYVIPAIYTGIIYLIVDRLQGKELKKHKENKGQFYSSWKATGIGAIYMLIIIAGIFGYVFFSPDNLNTAKYDNGIAEFQKNEEKALELFALLETADGQQATDFILATGIPIWQKNLQILDELDNIEGLYKELKDQNQVLREYCKLRIESYQLIGKAIKENTNLYDSQIEEINQKIEGVLEKL
ncbi:MAG: hypothetical protein JXA50_07895 [Deltaproteobacteria bacterium]|nr:hypothetical protein [Deltaproteobacteria bacterium]